VQVTKMFFSHCSDITSVLGGKH